MEVVFGIDVKKDNTAKHSYVLVSKMNLPHNGILHHGRGFPKAGLLMNLLGVIFMKGNCATEEDIWDFLGKMNIYAGKRHFLVGEPKKLITQDLVQLKYLEYQQVPGSDPACYEFLWGPRAHTWNSKMRVLEFLARINCLDPSAFHFLYEEALKDEEERAQASRCPSVPPAVPSIREAEANSALWGSREESVFQVVQDWTSPRVHSVKYLGVSVVYREFRNKSMFLCSCCFSNVATKWKFI